MPKLGVLIGRYINKLQKEKTGWKYFAVLFSELLAFLLELMEADEFLSKTAANV